MIDAVREFATANRKSKLSSEYHTRIDTTFRGTSDSIVAHRPIRPAVLVHFAALRYSLAATIDRGLTGGVYMQDHAPDSQVIKADHATPVEVEEAVIYA